MFGLEVLRSFFIIIGAQASKLGACDYGHKERAGGAAVVIELMEQREQSGACSNYAESRQKKTEGQQPSEEEFFLRFAMKASKGRAHRRNCKDL